MPSQVPKKLPEKKFGPFANGVGVAIWINETQTEQGMRLFRSVTIAPRRYFDRETNQWKDAGSYTSADLPGLIYGLQKALAYITDVPLPEMDLPESTDAPPVGSPSEVPF